MGPANILVIEDDVIVARTIERCLRGEEFRVTVTNNGVDGLKVARRHVPDLVILDVIMPGMDGYAVCREMRNDPILADVPILFLTAKVKDEDRIAGFRAGADDYLCKPFNLDELILRVRAILKRTYERPKPSSDNQAAKSLSLGQLIPGIFQGRKVDEKSPESPRTITLRGYTLDTKTFEVVTPHAGRIRLTPVQYDLLYHLMTHPGEIFSPQRLLDEVWNYPSDAGSPDLVRVHIKNLRERIEPDPKSPTFIETIPGYGYTIRKEEP
jgi:DNA-binding response OmpR family regulator